MLNKDLLGMACLVERTFAWVGNVGRFGCENENKTPKIGCFENKIVLLIVFIFLNFVDIEFFGW